MPDILIKRDGPRSTVTGETEAGVAFVDAWILGVLTVEDAGRITITSEVIDDLTVAARASGVEAEVV